MEFNQSIPIYLQVMTAIKREIVTGRLLLGEKLPSVRDLALQYTINPNTAGRVYRELEAEEVCFTRRGMGTFVTEDSERVARLKASMAQELTEEFLKGMRQLGLSEAEVLELLERHSRQMGKTVSEEDSSARQ